MPATQAKNFCFTLNNPVVSTEEWVDKFFEDEKPVFIIAGYEIAPKTGTPHLQGFCAFSIRRRYTGMATKYNASFRVAKGGLAANIDYCSKDGKVYERGERDDVAVQGGKRTNKEEAVIILNDIMTKRSRRELIREMPWQWRQINALNDERPDRSEAPKVLYIHGATGHGKTTTTKKVLNELGISAYWKPSAIKWWNGYDHQDCVILEEFTSCFNCTTFLQLCDETPMCVEFKGGMLKFDSKYIIILSNTAPDDQYPKVYDDNPARHDAYMRRVSNQLKTEPNNHELIRATLIDFFSAEQTDD